MFIQLRFLILIYFSTFNSDSWLSVRYMEDKITSCAPEKFTNYRGNRHSDPQIQYRMRIAMIEILLAPQSPVAEGNNFEQFVFFTSSGICFLIY